MRGIIKYKNLTWVNIIKPTKEDIEYLKTKFKLHPLTLKTIIPAIHYPDLDVFKNYILIIIHYPYSQKNGEIQVQEFDIIVGKDFLITNHYHEVSPLNSIFEQCLKYELKRKVFMGRGAGFLLFVILNRLFRNNLKKVVQIERGIDFIEKEIFSEKEKEVIKKISYLKMEILDLWRIIEPQRLIFEYLRNFGTKFFGQEFQHHFVSLFRAHRKIENALKNSKEAIESLEETNHILVTLKMNEIIKILTIFSVILLPLTLLASIWGMNTNFLPFNKTIVDFWVIIGLMVITSSVMIIYFKFKKWL
jgi:magnesium transporter